MGRGTRNNESQATTFATRSGASLLGERFGIMPPTGRDTASEAQRMRLENEMNVYANAALNRRVSVRLTPPNGPGECRRCKSQKHDDGFCPTCKAYEYSEASFTDMGGNITVYTGYPPELTPELLDRLGLPADTKPEDVLPALRELCTQGLLRHEWAHEWQTDPETFRAFAADLAKLDGISQEQIHGIWNSLEDGMIEEHMRADQPGAYQFISALNRIHPRVGQPYTTEADVKRPFKGDYIPTDANGNPLQVVDGHVLIPKGTTISPWGEHPLSVRDQMRAALLAEAVPEFAPGDLHPDVQAALDEIRPFIDAAVRGNTADCVANAYKIHKLLLDRGLLRDGAELKRQRDEWAKKIKQGIEDGTIEVHDLRGQPSDALSGISMPVTAPAVPQQPSDDQQGGQSGQPGGQGGQPPQNPTPDVDGAIEFGDNLKRIIIKDGDGSDGGGSGGEMDPNAEELEISTGGGGGGDGNSLPLGLDDLLGDSNDQQSGDSGSDGQQSSGSSSGGPQSDSSDSGGQSGTEEDSGEKSDASAGADGGENTDASAGQGASSGSGGGAQSTADGDTDGDAGGEGQGAGSGAGSKNDAGGGDQGAGGQGGGAGSENDAGGGDQGAGGQGGGAGSKNDESGDEGDNGQGAGNGAGSKNDADGDGQGAGSAGDKGSRDEPKGTQGGACGHCQGTGRNASGSACGHCGGTGDADSGNAADAHGSCKNCGGNKGADGRCQSCGKTGRNTAGSTSGASNDDSQPTDGKDKAEADGGNNGPARSQAQQRDGEPGGDSAASDPNDTTGDGGAHAPHQGGSDGGGAYKPGSGSLPQGSREAHDRDGTGHVDDEELRKMVRDAKDRVQGDKIRQNANETRDAREGRITGENMLLPTDQAMITQRELTQTRQKHQKAALAEEEGALSRAGLRLAAELKAMKVRARGPRKYRQRGKLDTKSGLARAVAGSRHVFMQEGSKLDMDLEILIKADLSASIASANQTTNVFRMCKMFGVQARETKIPTAIHGFDSDNWRRDGGPACRHFEYKTAHSDDLAGLDAIFETGGGSTPTDLAVEHGRVCLKLSKAKKKILVVVTDGDPNDLEATHQQIQEAQKQGILVLGLGFAGGCSAEKMAEQYGTSFAIINKFTDAPRVVGEILKREILSTR